MNNVKKVISVIIIVIFATLLLPLAIVYLMGTGSNELPEPVGSEAVNVMNDETTLQQQ